MWNMHCRNFRFWKEAILHDWYLPRHARFSERVHSSMKGDDCIESEFLLSVASLLGHQESSKEVIESPSWPSKAEDLVDDALIVAQLDSVISTSWQTLIWVARFAWSSVTRLSLEIANSGRNVREGYVKMSFKSSCMTQNSKKKKMMSSLFRIALNLSNNIENRRKS